MNETTFLAAIRGNQGIILKLVGLYARDPEEKKDLYQEILLRAWKGWPSFRGDAKFSTWLYSICLNTILTQKRKPGIIEYRDSIDTVAPASANKSEQQENAASLQHAIRLLPETDRAMLSLHLDGFANTEIAELLGISDNLVAVKLHRCRQQLKTLLMNTHEQTTNDTRTAMERTGQ